MEQTTSSINSNDRIGYNPSYDQSNYVGTIQNECIGSTVPVIDPSQANRIRSISIRQLNQGYLVSVGCHEFAIESSASLISKLSQYISEPDLTEKKWFDKKLF